MANTNYTKSVAGVLIRDGKVLLVRHTYGAGNGLLIIPGGYVEENESPEEAVVREFQEETTIAVRPESIIGVRFNMHDWYVVFRVAYVSGEPHSDGDENSEVVWMDTDDALTRDDVPGLSKSLIRSALSGSALSASDYPPTGRHAPQSLYAFAE